MEHRSTERRGRVTARLSALTCLAGLVVSTLMVLSPPADAAAGSGGGGQGTGRSCKKEDSGQQSKTKCVGPVGGAMAGIDATNLAEQLLSSVAKSAGSKIGGELAGWALESI